MPLNQVPNPDMIDLQFQQKTDPFPDQIILDAPPSKPTVAPYVADNQAKKYDAGLGKYSPGPEQLTHDIMSNQEAPSRENTMFAKQLDDRKQRLQLASEFMMKLGANATPQDTETIMAMTNAEKMESQDNPTTFWEKMFAKHVVNNSHGQGAMDAVNEEPTMAHAILDMHEKTVAQKEVFQKLLEDGEAKYAAEGLGTKILANTETFVPFFTWGSVLSAMPSDMAMHGQRLPGQLLEDSYLDVMQQPTVEKTRERALAIFNDMYDSSKTDAVQWLRGLAGFSTSDKYLNNLIGITDIASVLPAGYLLKGGKVIAKTATAALASTTRDGLKAIGTRTFTPTALKVVAGEAEEAAGDVAVAKVLKKATVVDTPGPPPVIHGFEDLTGELNSFFNPAAAIGQDSLTLTPEASQRMIADLEHSRDILQDATDNSLSVTRIDGPKLAAARDAAKANWNAQYPELADTVLRVEPINAAETKSGVDELGVHLGTKQGLPFKTEGAARTAANRYYELRDPFEIKKYGDSQFYLEIKKPIDETDPLVRDIPLGTKSQTPKTLKNVFFGGLRTAADLIAPKLFNEYLTAAYGSSAFLKRIQEAARPFSVLRGKTKKDMNRFLQVQRVARNDEGVIGRFSEDQRAFETEWLHNIGRNPTVQESHAYWSYRQLNDFGYSTYNMSLLRDKLRQGLELFHFPWEMGERLAGPNAVPKPTLGTRGIEGKFIRGGIDNLPWETALAQKGEDAGILIHSRYAGETRTVRMKYTNPEKLKAELNGEEYQLIQVSPEGKRMLTTEPGYRARMEELGDFQFILTKEFETTHLPWQQIPYRPGGPVEFPQGWFVSQPQITKILQKGITVEHRYHGDVNAFNFQTESQARAAAKDMELGRQLLLAGKTAELEAHLPKTLPFTSDEFQALFRSEKNLDALLDINTPIYARQMNKNLFDTEKLADKYHNLVNNKKSLYNLFNQVNLKSALERNDPIFTFSKTGDPDLPIFNLKQAEMLDPIATMQRSAASLMKGRFIEDLKFKTAENFLVEFAGVLRPSLQEMRTNPLKALLDGDFIAGADRTTLAAAKNYRRVAINFLGLKNEHQKNMVYLKQKLADFIFEKGGEGPFKLVEPYLLHQTRDPIGFFRSVAFHTYLGLFNPVQMFLQAQTITHMIGVEGPVKTFKGAAAATFMRTLVFNDSPEILAGAARKAAAVSGMPEAHFKESWKWLKASGFWNVGEEHAMRDSLLDPQTFSSLGSRFVDKGLMFFREGERFTRLTAWNTAYTSWKHYNPTRELDQVGAKEILGRANTLNVDMSSASLAAWNKGWASVPTQFFNYQARLTEQFLSKRLTNVEKMRALTTYSIMYGAPVALGVSSYPWYEDVRRQLMERGINYDDNLLSKTFIDGIASVALEAATGTKFNYGSRFGPSGLSMWNDVFSGDKSIVEMLSGAAGMTAGSYIMNAAPVLSSLAHTITGDSSYLPVLANDVESFARQISSVNQAFKMYYAINLGQYISKNGVQVDKVTGWEGTIMGLMGVVPQRTDDIFRMTESNKMREDAQNNARMEYNKYIKQAVTALNKEDMDGYAAAWKQANLWIQAGGFRPDEAGSLFSSAMKQNPMGESVEKKFYNKDPARLPLYMEQLRKKQELLNGSNR